MSGGLAVELPASPPDVEAGYTGPARVISVQDLTIHQRMIFILSELPAIGKDQRNEQQKFMYRGHDDVMNALNPLLAKWGVYVVPDVLERVTGERTTQRGSTMYEVNLHVRYSFYGLKGDVVIATAWGEGTDSGDKSTNKAMTMAFKNVLAQVFAISTAELSDTDGDIPEETTRASGLTTATIPNLQQEAERDFDPGRDVLEGAARGEKLVEELAGRMQQLDPSLDWQATIAQAWEGERTPEFWRRLSNCLEWIYQAGGAEKGDFPPVVESMIIAGFAWAFNGVEVTPEYLGGTDAAGPKDQTADVEKD